MRFDKFLGAIAILAAALAVATASGQPLGTVEQELSKVRQAGEELYNRKSSVFGTLPGPEELAAHQMRCRPLPIPNADARHEMEFDKALRDRAAKLDPNALAKIGGRLGMTVVPVGITGAYVVEAMGKPELLVVHVLPDSPAAGVLKRNDILIGANGRLFVDPEDPRPELGNALCESQSPQLKGILTLQIVRDRKPMNVRIGLGSTLDFSETWPYDCEKTKQVRAAALKYVMTTPRGRYDFWTPLFLMASGDDEALEMVRRDLCAGLKDSYEESTGASAWSGGYRLTCVCEYYLLTGDSSVLPLIKNLAEGVSWAQYRSGSWSHGGGKNPNVTAPGMASGGYGEVNCAGLGALIGLCLARQCGVVPYKHTIPRSIRFFGPFCGENLGYGLGTPSDSRTGRMDNGMNGMSAMVFHLLGEEEMARRWARSTCYMWMGRERGHAEAIFSAAWGPVCADLAPRPEFHAFMNHMKWAYEMGRTRDGGLSFMRGSRWDYPNMTAAYGLFLYLPEKRLQVLGGDSVFAHKPPAGLEEAARLYREKRWKDLRKFLDDHLAGGPDSKQHEQYAKGMLAAHDRLEKHAAATRKIIERTIAAGDARTAQVQLDVLAKFVGQERPEAAALRKKLGSAGKPRGGGKREKPKVTLVDVNALMKERKFAKGGIRDGWAHSPQYIAATNEQGFAGMTPEAIAPYLGHFSGGVVSGAVQAIATYGERAIPVLKTAVGDTHPGVRAGAIDAITRVYATETDEPRMEVPPQLAGVIKLIRPRIEDESKLVRASVANFVMKLNVVNDDIYEMLNILAAQGAGLQSFVRHKIKDPQARTRLCMTIVDGLNKRRATTPGDYKPLLFASTPHMELCGPYLQTAIDTLNNPEAQIMYGFFSNHPQDAALNICAAYHEDPRVLKNLPVMIRCAMMRGGCNTYWDVHKEFPHRIAILIGPDAIPVIEEHWRREKAMFAMIQRGRAPMPRWWKPEAPTWFDENECQWQDTIELIRCLCGVRTGDDAVAGMMRHYFRDRWWAAWERAHIWHKLIEMGPGVMGSLKESGSRQWVAALRETKKLIVAKEAEIAAETDRNKKRGLEKQVAELKAKEQSIDALGSECLQLASLIEALNAAKPTEEAVRKLCAFYLRPPYGEQYPYLKEGNGLRVRKLHAKEDALIREKLLAWGSGTLSAIRQCLAKDAAALPAKIKKLDEEVAFWKTQWSRKAGGPLKRIAGERTVLARQRQELTEVADVIDLTAAGNLTDEQIATLCRIHMHHDWPCARKAVAAALARRKAQAAPVIAKVAQDEQSTMDHAEAQVKKLMGSTVDIFAEDTYNHYKALAGNIRGGIKELRGL